MQEFSADIGNNLRKHKQNEFHLTMFFLNNVSKRFKKKIAGFSDEVMNIFEEFPWPGNVRQLLHEVERLIALTPAGEQVSMMHCSQELKNWSESPFLTELRNNTALSLSDKVKELEIECIKNALHDTNGNKRQASKLLGITRQGLDKKMKRYDIGNLAKEK